LLTLLDEKIGSGWKKELSELKKLEKFIDDKEVCK
jgi:glucan phosphorylase